MKWKNIIFQIFSTLRLNKSYTTLLWTEHIYHSDNNIYNEVHVVCFFMFSLKTRKLPSLFQHKFFFQFLSLFETFTPLSFGVHHHPIISRLKIKWKKMTIILVVNIIWHDPNVWPINNRLSVDLFFKFVSMYFTFIKNIFFWAFQYFHLTKWRRFYKTSLQIKSLVMLLWNWDTFRQYNNNLFAYKIIENSLI